MLAHAVVWAGLVVPLFDVMAASVHTFVIVTCLLSSAFNTMVTATIPAVISATIAPSSLTTLGYVIFVKHGAGEPVVALFDLALAAHVFFSVLAKRFHQLASESLVFPAKKNELITELEQAKANSDEAGAPLKKPIWRNRASSPP